MQKDWKKSWVIFYSAKRLKNKLSHFLVQKDWKKSWVIFLVQKDWKTSQGTPGRGRVRQGARGANIQVRQKQKNNTFHGDGGGECLGQKKSRQIFILTITQHFWNWQCTNSKFWSRHYRYALVFQALSAEKFWYRIKEILKKTICYRYIPPPIFSRFGRKGDIY